MRFQPNISIGILCYHNIWAQLISYLYFISNFYLIQVLRSAINCNTRDNPFNRMFFMCISRSGFIYIKTGVLNHNRVTYIVQDIYMGFLFFFIDKTHLTQFTTSIFYWNLQDYISMIYMNKQMMMIIISMVYIWTH